MNTSPNEIERKVIAVSDDRKILSFLNRLIHSRSEVALFELKENGERELKSVANIQSIDLIKRRFLLTPSKGGNFPNIEFGKVLLYAKYKDLTLVSRIRSKGSNYLEIEIPKEVTITEERKNSRTQVFNQFICCDLHIEGFEKSHPAIAFDTSEKGASFIIKKPLFDYIKKDMLIYIESSELIAINEQYVLVSNKYVLDQNQKEKTYKIGCTIIQND